MNVSEYLHALGYSIGSANASTYMQPISVTMSEAILARLAEHHDLQPAAIVVEALDGPPAWRYRADRPLYPASMIKVPLVAAALLLRARGELSGGAVPIDPANLTANDGPSPLVEGYAASLDELCELAITRSDNVATNQLYDIVGRERASRLVRRELGLRDTGFRRKLSGAHPLVRDPGQSGRNSFPASDAARLFGLIARGAFAGADVIYSLLLRQEWNAKLSEGLRAGDRFAHKTGDTQTVSHDGGILTTAEGRRYTIVVYTGCASSDTTDARFASLMRELRPLLDAL